MFKNIKKPNLLCAVLSFICNVFIFMPTIIYGGQNFSVDSYGIALDYKIHLEAFIGSYRWFGACVYKLYYELFGHNPISDCTIDIIFFIITAAAIVSLLSFSLLKLINSKSILSYIVINLSVLISLLNVWFCDILSFPECVFITTIGMVLCYSAVIVFIKNQSISGYILTSVLIILATGIYQQFLFIFTIFVVCICGCEIIKNSEKTFKELFFRYIKPIILIIVSGGIYFAVGKIVQKIFDIVPNERVSLSVSTIIDNCLYFIRNQHSYLKGRGYFKSEILTVCFLLIGFIWLLYIISEWIKNRNTLKTLLLCASYVCAFISAYAPGIISTSRTARTILALFSVFALFSIGVLILSRNNYTKAIICAILSTVLISNIYVSVNCELNLKKQNEIDRIWCEQVIEEIKKHENENIKIKEIRYCYDDKTDIREYTDSAACYQYSLSSMIKYYSGRNFKVYEMNAEDKSIYFKGNNWNNINIKEQLIFADDILYLCCY